jgi:adenylate cyclase
MNKTYLKPLGLALLVTLLTAGFFITNSFQGLEFRSIDHRFAKRGPRAAASDVVIITADEKSFSALGLWPWARRLHGRLIDRLTKAGAKAIAFDILFLEDDKARPGSDEELGRAAARSGKVVFGMLFQQNEGGKAAGPAFPIEALHAGDNIQVGSVNFNPETDGVCRKVPAWIEFQDNAIPSLSLAAYAVAHDMTVSDAIQKLKIPVLDSENAWNEFFLNFVGGYQSFPYYSFSDVLAGKVPDEVFKDKVVFVGGTATGLFDFKAVPNVPYYPGLEIHANAYENYVDGTFLRQIPVLWTLLLILIFGMVSGFFAARAPTWSWAVSGGLIAAYYAAARWAFSRNVLLDFVWPVIVVLASYLVVFFYRFRTERQEKRWIKSTFSQYMSPKIVEAITKNPELLKLGGEDREMTVFFSDLAGFTSISEAMTPRELVSVLNEYLTEMSNIIFYYGGVVDKYIGDAIMAFWNAPIDQPDHAVLACYTALDQVEKLKELQKRFADRKLPPVDFRVGVNTGHMVVGNMGSHSRFDYTVMGDAVNLAARLEGANKPFRTRIMISEFTYAKAKDALEVRPLDLLRVKGKTVPVQVYELAARKGQLSPEQKKAFAAYNEGMAFYRDKKFERAIDAFKKNLAALPDDGPARTYVERCENFLAFPPPPSWDGVYVMTTK